MNEPGEQAAQQAGVDVLHEVLNIDDVEAIRRLPDVLWPYPPGFRTQAQVEAEPFASAR